ncbi:glycoside hydrolase family 3 N-terminal domain-containing protein [Neobacillus sp. OS1-33]|uniref:glycoside hydrolase family 3 protein n=1 Tax=Neobacillus sp. OS1-33 TaxID=3070683 RepID=UPI0027DF2DAB|nr:glycoside hydrolase family 3 N-terminal domain-containing protein [Neobacillus sp. OS1-33]WML26447.1 glycoside hydrolase family 3 N-terminal domain-containing protein [Neobacillus sp. OS1-33]
MKLFSKKASTITIAALMLSSLAIPYASAEPGKSNGNKQNAPSVEARSKQILTQGEKKFKDLNNNGRLDPYENWQVPIDVRVKDLIKKMTLEEKAGMMLITEFPQFKDNKLVLPNKLINQNTRYYIFRKIPTTDVIADYNNQLQEVAEGSRLGIPIVITSNPRNHASTDYTNNSEGAGLHSFWPGPLGLAATRDTRLVKDFAETAAKEWRASGIRKVYGYTADIATDPLWARIEDTFGEQPELASDMIYNVIKGFQGEELGKDSVSITVKHFPGGGARDNGLDPHFVEGKFNPYPTEGSLLKYHIPTFKAAIAAGVSSVMPYYAFPSNTSADQGLPWFNETQQFEEVGFALNKAIITDLLRGQLGFKGYVNSDTGAVGNNAWGAEGLTPEQKFAKAIDAGTNIISGASDPTPIINAVKNGLLAEEKVDESVTFLLNEMMKLGLFENPYVDRQNALNVVNNPESQKKADEAHRKSLVLLRNDTVNGKKVLPLGDSEIKDVKLYIEMFPGGNDAAATQKLKETIQKYDPSIIVTDNLAEATHAFVWVRPVQSNWDNNPRITVGPETGINNVDKIIEIQKKVPTITAINFTNPWLIDQIEPNAAAVISTFGVKAEAIVDVIRGKFKPTGKLPFTIPANKEAVDNEVGDIPGYVEDPSYVYKNKNGDSYGFDFGLTYK